MNAQDIMNALNNLLDLGDTLDNAGGGVQGLTDGAHTTREVCKLQLGQFLLYIADGCSSINDGQAAVLNLVFHEGYGDTSPEQYMELAKTMDPPDPSSNLTLLAFKQGDMALSAQNGTTSTALTDILINTYEAFGKLVVAANESIVAQSRFDRMFNQLKAEANQSGFGGTSFSTSGDGGSRTSNGFVTNGDVLTRYEGQSKNVVIPEGITRIDDDAFSGMESLETVGLPRSIRVIGTSAFRQCEKLKSIDLPEGLTEIEYDAFTYCESLTSVDIPSTVTSIGGDAFCFCNGIKKIRIPASLTDIGNDAFMYCNDLETVVVYGGNRSNSALDRMKEHFPDGVKIMWDGDEQSKPKSSRAAKKASGKSKKTSTSGKAASSKPGTSQNVKASPKTIAGGQTAKYNEQVSFALSREYNMVWDKNDDGDDVCKIVSVRTSSADSENPDITVFISVVSNDDQDKEPIDVIEDNDQDQSTKIRFHSEPDALLSITNIDMQILSMNFRTNVYRLFIRLSQEEVLQLLLTKTSSDGENRMMEDITTISDLWRCVRINGKAVDLGEADTAQSFVNYLTELSKNEGKSKEKKSSSSKSSTAGSKTKTRKKKEKTIIRTKPEKIPDAEQYKGIHQVEDEAELIAPLGTWSVPVPPGFSYTMDSECAGGGFTGKYQAQIQTTEDCNFDNAYDSRFNFVLFSSIARIDEYSALTDLSTDEAANKMMEMASALDKRYTFFKRTESLTIMVKEEVVESEQYSVMFLIFYRGVQYAVNGQVVVNGSTQEKAREEINAFLNSIEAIEQPDGEEGYKPFVLPEEFGLTYHEHQKLKLDGVIDLPIPDGYKGSTNQDLIGAPRRFAIVPEDYSGFKQAMDATIGITCVPVGGQPPLFTLGRCDEVVAMMRKQMEQAGIFSERGTGTIAQMTTKGIIFFQSIYGEDTKKYIVGKALMWAEKSAFVITVALNFDEEIADHDDVNIDAKQIISDWLNRIELPGEKLYYIPPKPGSQKETNRIANLVCPPTPELLHEHFDLVTGGGYTTRRDADFIGQSIRGLMEKTGSTGEKAYGEMRIAGDTYDLDKTAESLAQVFRLDASLFDPYTDQEALIRLGAFTDVRMLHALRSLSWMVNRFADQETCSLKNISFSDLQKMGEIIRKKNYLNYDGETGFVALCNHYDWHVFYVPDQYKNSDTAMNTDLRNLTGKENRGGNTTSVFFPGMGIDGLRAMNRKNEIISRNEETLESLEALRKGLIDMLPVMQTIHDGLMQDRNRSEKLEGVLAEALTAWCALAIAAKEPFYSEEAADTYEANAGLKGPLQRPADGQDEQLIAQGTANPITAKRINHPLPEGEVLDLGGATIVSPGQFAGNMTLKNIIIPEGVTEIGDQAFNTCMFLETVVLPTTLKKIGKMAFMSCRSLRQVEIPEGVEEICDHAFAATNNLKEVYLPDSLQRVDRYIFGLGGDSPYATAYMSGDLATRLQSNSKDSRFLSAISARRYVIDGVGYENMYDYGKPSASSGFSSEAVSKSADEYKDEMERACKEKKSLQDMIETGRKAVYAAEYGDKDAFEQAIKNLDREATVTFSGKHFVLTGFGTFEDAVKAEIEKRGGIIHSSMVKMADYLIVCLESPGASKVKKALEWRQKGAKNQIVSDYQMWQAIFGKATPSSKSVKKEPEKKPADGSTTTSRKTKTEGKKPSESAKKAKTTAETKPKQASKASSPKPKERKYGWIGDILPDGSDQAEIEKELEEMSDEDAQNTIEAMRQLKALQGQLSEIGDMIDQAQKEEEEKAEKEKREAEERAKREAEERNRREQALREREEADRKAAEARKKAERDRINEEIYDLTSEMNSLRGLFAGMKRKKLQKRINELNEELRKM